MEAKTLNFPKCLKLKRKLKKRGEKDLLLEEREHTEHLDLARQTAGGQGRFSVVEVVREDVVPQVGGARGHAKGRGTEEARAE